MFIDEYRGHEYMKHYTRMGLGFRLDSAVYEYSYSIISVSGSINSAGWLDGGLRPFILTDDALYASILGAALYILFQCI